MYIMKLNPITRFLKRDVDRVTLIPSYILLFANTPNIKVTKTLRKMK